MTYNEFIQNIIDTRGQWNLSEETIYHNHHIIPLCLGGQPIVFNHNTKHENLIWLTYPEHQEAHRLLYEEHPENGSLKRAYAMMFGRDEGYTGVTRGNTGMHYYNNGVHMIACFEEDVPEGYVKGSLNPGTSGYHWYNNGTEQSMFKDINDVPDGWVAGMLPNFGNDSCKDRISYTNGIKNIRLYQDSEIPEGFYRGVTINPENKTYWYNNGVEYKRFRIGEEPQGWVRGAKRNQKSWWTNGIDNKFCTICPDGWWEGKTKKVRKKKPPKVWYYNGEESLKCYENEQPEGYYRVDKYIVSKSTKLKLSLKHKNKSYNKGRKANSETKRKQSEAQKGKHWYNNGVENVRANECPDGFVPGMLNITNSHSNEGQHWYNNGIINKMFFEGQEEAGFVRGRILTEEELQICRQKCLIMSANNKGKSRKHKKLNEEES